MRSIVLASTPAQAGSLGYPRYVTLPSPCTHALAAMTCAATLLLAACGSPTVTVTPSTSTSAASSPTAAPQPFAGTGFRTDIPMGWQDQTANQSAVAALGGSGTVLMLLASSDGGLIVARSTPQPVADDQLAQYLTGVIPAGATAVSPTEPIDVDGMSGVVTTFVVIPSGAAARKHEEMVVNRAGNTYDISLSTAQTSFALDEAALQAILNGWRWA
jgi:hypothetical protein